MFVGESESDLFRARARFAFTLAERLGMWVSSVAVVRQAAPLAGFLHPCAERSHGDLLMSPGPWAATIEATIEPKRCTVTAKDEVKRQVRPTALLTAGLFAIKRRVGSRREHPCRCRTPSADGESG